eukprot:3218301-Rhodomonas_salina.1
MEDLGAPSRRYQASDWNVSGQTLMDSSSSMSHSVSSSGVARDRGAGNGARGEVDYIYGNHDSHISWADGTIPPTFTI